MARLKGAIDALGLDGEHRLDIVLMQLVKLVRDGQVVRMSKPRGRLPLFLQRQARDPDGV